MVVYYRDWSGRRRSVNSTINYWDPQIAELPDLTQMESITYVNEIDIQKVEKGQKVQIGLDANPDKKLEGVVKQVASIGEQRRNSDSKVFEVIISVIDTDTTLRPAMTTSNIISIASVDSVVYIPLECIHTINDTTYVYKISGGNPVLQIVELGLINDNDVIIVNGITRQDEISLSLPEGFQSKDKTAIKETL